MAAMVVEAAAVLTPLTHIYLQITSDVHDQL